MLRRTVTHGAADVEAVTVRRDAALHDHLNNVVRREFRRAHTEDRVREVLRTYRGKEELRPVLRYLRLSGRGGGALVRRSGVGAAVHRVQLERQVVVVVEILPLDAHQLAGEYIRHDALGEFHRVPLEHAGPLPLTKSLALRLGLHRFEDFVLRALLVALERVLVPSRTQRADTRV